MKTLMKKNKLNINYLFFVTCLLLTFGACTSGFDEINRKVDDATEEELGYDLLGVGSLITQIQSQIYPSITKAQNLDVNNYQKMFNLAGDVYSGHQGATSNFDNNGRNNTTYNMIPDWYSVAYNVAFQNYMNPWYSLLNKKGISPSAFAVGQILKVFGMHRITDMYGPIPYKDFFPASEVPFTPQDVVYDLFFEELDEAIAILEDFINNNPGAKPMAAYDWVYEGDYEKWIKFANSLKLLLAIRIVYADEGKAKQKAEEAITGGVFLSNADNAMLQVNGTSTINPLHMICHLYDDTRLGATMESYLKGYNDPRLPLLFNPSKVSGVNRDYNGVRSGISMDPDAYTVCSELNVTASTSIQFMAAAEVYFLRAEAALRGWNAGGTAKDLYEEGIRTAFDQPIGGGQGKAGDATDYIAGTTKPQPYKDPINSSYNYPETGDVSVKWEESLSQDKLLEKIITQKWIALFPDGQEAWSEFRRTGCPRVIPIDGNVSGGNIDVKKQIARLPYPDELKGDYPELYNEALKLLNGADTGGIKLWWDKRTNKPYQ